MTNEKLNTAIYKKMFAEQEVYRAWLVTQPPNEILNHAYEYTMREDILMSLEENDLSSKGAQALLKSESPLDDVFKVLISQEGSYMEDIWAAVEGRANHLIRYALEQAKENRQQER